MQEGLRCARLGNTYLDVHMNEYVFILMSIKNANLIFISPCTFGICTNVYIHTYMVVHKM